MASVCEPTGRSTGVCMRTLSTKTFESRGETAIEVAGHLVTEIRTHFKPGSHSVRLQGLAEEPCAAKDVVLGPYDEVPADLMRRDASSDRSHFVQVAGRAGRRPEIHAPAAIL